MKAPKPLQSTPPTQSDCAKSGLQQFVNLLFERLFDLLLLLSADVMASDLLNAIFSTLFLCIVRICSVISLPRVVHQLKNLPPVDYREVFDSTC